jgi:hypothetical protein
MRPLLALDFDDVIFPFMETFVPHYNETYDVKIIGHLNSRKSGATTFMRLGTEWASSFIIHP